MIENLLHACAALLPPAYRRHLGWCREWFGTTAALRAALLLLASRGAPVAVPAPGGGTVRLRPGTADESVFVEIFLEREYAVDVPDAEYIVDAGAHIGCASLFFNQRFPSARIIAIEPDEKNFELLTQNLAGVERALPVKGALWSHATQVAIKNGPHWPTWSYRVNESEASATVPAFSVTDLFERFELPRIDLLKIDIEGAEIEALQDAERWIDRVGTMIVETHDRWFPGSTAAVDSATAGQGFSRRSASGGQVAILERRGWRHGTGQQAQPHHA